MGSGGRHFGHKPQIGIENKINVKIGKTGTEILMEDDEDQSREKQVDAIVKEFESASNN